MSIKNLAFLLIGILLLVASILGFVTTTDDDTQILSAFGSVFGLILIWGGFHNIRYAQSRGNAQEPSKKAEELYEKGGDIFTSLGFLPANAIHVDGSPLQLAIDCFAGAVKFDPGHGRAWFRLGQCLKMNGNQAEALKCFNEALKTELDPTWRTWVEDEKRKLT